MEPPRPARGASAEELLELVHQVQGELELRDEAPTGPWVEESATDLRSGAKAGWYYPLEGGGGVAFRTERESVSFAHVHVAHGPEATPRAVALSGVLLDSLPETIRSVSVGFTGLTTEQEETVTSRLAERTGSTVIRRFAMERELRSRDGEGLPPVPDALTLVPVRDISLDALSQLDQRAFHGTTDELLIGSELEEYTRVLAAYLAGTVGRFLDEASTALYRADPPTLVGAILTCEKTARRAVFQDFMVDPAHRSRGYGAYLLHWAMRSLWALGYERVRLWVSESNESARRLYDSVGFSVTHSAVIYRWDRPALGPQPQSAR
jgi:ribosomal protein S18 acetylase RimI-like enzyme